MARARSADRLPPSLHRTLSTPGLYLWRMFVFLVLVGLLIAVLYQQLWDAMLNNPGLNFLICFVLVAGICYAFPQVLRLYPEIRWVNAFRIADPGLAISHRPVLLAPMATMLRDRTGSLSLSATSMRSIMDSIGSRLDEARDTGRYLVGLLVFLGLLGTFWGLLDTIQSVGKTISALDIAGRRQRHRVRRAEERPRRAAARHGHRLLVLAAGPRRLAGAGLPGAAGEPRARPLLQPAGGMAVGHHRAGARRARRPPTSPAASSTRPSHDMHRAISDLSERLGRASRGRSGGAPQGEEAVKELAKGVDQLVRQMRAEQKVVREWVDEQAAQQSEVASVLKDLAANVRAQGLEPWPTRSRRAGRQPTASSGRATWTCCPRCCWSSPS